jgi:3-methyladenine DNA glycosylase AlkC
VDTLHAFPSVAPFLLFNADFFASLQAMAEPLKNAFSPAVVAGIADDLARVAPGFDRAAFLRQATKGLLELELTARGRHVATAMRVHLPQDYPAALHALVASFGPPLTVTEGFGMAVFRYLPHANFIAEHGPKEQQHLDASLEALHALTRRFTAEWAIRPFIEGHYDHTMRTLGRWIEDESAHVRRLVSEGTRPRLPWAGRLRCFQQDPTPTLALLDRLVDDSELYVRRSVANHLGDIAKDHPELAVATAKRWVRARGTVERRWVATHGLRSLAKQGHAGALTVLGVGERPHVTLSRVSITPRRPRIGERVVVSALLTATGKRPQDLRVDLVVHYAKANGGTGAKTFIVDRVQLKPGAALVIEHPLKLADLTTRVHHPGEHRVELLVNGERLPLGAFTLMR